ncbi:ISAzo13-like element transposase-related protein [Rhodoglobus vestalii]|uniref:ISAzo13-like element transposase-related protein n=1 Tax=Rhodoglobus vestalii TaxID=193384 RepID=UPI003CCC856D
MLNNWRGRPLRTHQIIVDLISHTTTKTGLTVDCVLDNSEYPIGLRYTTKEGDALPLHPPQIPRLNGTIPSHHTTRPKYTRVNSLRALSCPGSTRGCSATTGWDSPSC